MTFESWMDYVDRFLPAFDDIDAADAWLVSNGHRAHRVYRDSLRQFAVDESSLSDHFRCQREKSKEKASRARPLQRLRATSDRYYNSRLIQGRTLEVLSEFGAESVKAFGELYPKQQWRLEIDPVLRMREKFRFESPAEFSAYANQLQSSITSALEQEVADEAGQPPDGFGDSALRFKTFRNEAHDQLTKLGFRERRTQHPDHILYSYDIGGGLVVSWSVDDSSKVCAGPKFGVFESAVYVRFANDVKRLENLKLGTFLNVPYEGLVDGFVNAYLNFGNTKQMRAVIAANFCMIGYFLKFIVRE